MQPDPVKQSSKAIDQVKEATDQVKPAPESLEEAAKSVQEQLRASLDAFLDRLPLLGASLAIIAVTWILSRGMQAILAWLLGHSPVSESKQVLISRGAAVLVWALGILLAIVVGFPGLSTSKAFGILAIGSVAFGFAFRDLAENMFAGVVLLSQFPFDHGDFIDSGATSGTVEEVTLRMTKLRTVSGELVVVPNSVLYRAEISILTDRDRRRTTVDVTIAYGSDVEAAAKTIEEAIARCESAADDPPPEALPWDFAASGITMRVAWWTSPRPLEIRRSRAEAVGAIYRALNEAEIVIPFPHRTIQLVGPEQGAAREDVSPR